MPANMKKGSYKKGGSTKKNSGGTKLKKALEAAGYQKGGALQNLKKKLKAEISYQKGRMDRGTFLQPRKEIKQNLAAEKARNFKTIMKGPGGKPIMEQKNGGSLLYKMSGGPMMDMSNPMVMKMRGHGGGMQSMKAKMPKAGSGKNMKY